MSDTHDLGLVGHMTQGEHPDWEPLEKAVGEDVAGWFMWMFEVDCEGDVILQAYKHQITRRYLHLAPDGSAYHYNAGASFGDPARYAPIPLPMALEDTLATWWDSRFADEASIAAGREAIARARERHRAERAAAERADGEEREAA